MSGVNGLLTDLRRHVAGQGAKPDQLAVGYPPRRL